MNQYSAVAEALVDRLAQAFAAHREAAEKAVIDWLESLYDDGESVSGMIHRNELRPAIERGDHRKG